MTARSTDPTELSNDIRNWAPGDMRNWTPLLLRCGDGGGLVQVVHGRDLRAAPRPHAAGGAARGRGLWAHLGKPGSRALLRPGRHGLDQAGPALLAQPVAVAADGDDLAVVQQAIENRGGRDRVTEHAADRKSTRLNSSH